MRRVLCVLFALAMAVPVGALPTLGLAQKKAVKTIRGKDKILYRKKTVIDFEDNTVEGELVKPEGGYSVNRGRAKFGSLINIRRHFVREMWKNARKL